MKKFRILSVAAAALLTLTCCSFPASAVGEMRDISTMELVRDMGIGINLGNTLDCCPDWYGEDWIAKWSDGKPENYETGWGSPVITKEIIEGMAKEGFGVLRVPVAWSNKMEHDGTYTINKDFDARVHQIVDWALESGMYVIINIHWDGGWVNNFPDAKDESMQRFAHMWEQIAASFRDYSDYLMFESQNEELGWEKIWNPWSGTQEQKAVSYALCKEINQKFVDVVRASGGNNAMRHLLISGYNTGIDRTCDGLFKMPNDPANRMAVSVHYYSPAGFAILEEDADWGKASATWGSDQEYASLRSEMDMLKNTFTSRGIPVIIGEYGCPTKNKEPESVRRFLTAVCDEAYKRGHCPVLWSTPGGHYNRDTYKMEDQQLQQNLYQIGGKAFSPKTAEQPQPVAGDINQDGTVSLADAVTLQKYLLNQCTLSAEAAALADLNADGKLNAADFTLLKRILLQE